MLPLLLRQPVAIFANDIRELGFHVLDLMGRETVWIGSLSVRLMGDGERRSWREYGGGGNSCLLAEFASGDAMGAVFWRLAHGEAWSCIPYPRVNRNIPITRSGWVSAFIPLYRLRLREKPRPPKKYFVACRIWLWSPVVLMSGPPS